MHANVHTVQHRPVAEAAATLLTVTNVQPTVLECHSIPRLARLVEHTAVRILTPLGSPLRARRPPTLVGSSEHMLPVARDLISKEAQLALWPAKSS